MTVFQTIALLLCIAALAAYLNGRFLKLPTTISIMAIGMACSSLLVLIDRSALPLDSQVRNILGQIDFYDALMNGMLSFLLFAGALHVDLTELDKQRGPVAAFASIGVLIATAVTAVLLHWIAPMFGQTLSFGYCLVFGALIAPTDPVAVMSLLKQAKAPRSLQLKIVGESLFNDGVAVVIFTMTLDVALGGELGSGKTIAVLLLREVVGGAAVGLAAGGVAYHLLKTSSDYKVDVLITLALVAGGYSFAQAIHTSGPVAMVVAGLLIGNRGRAKALTAESRRRLDDFWELIDEVLNAVLFVLIGLEIVLVQFRGTLIIGVCCILITLLARAVGIGIPALMFRKHPAFELRTTPILVWGGLRGGVSVALALSLPPSKARDVIVSITYVVVVFSMLGQGLTFRRVMQRFLPTSASS